MWDRYDELSATKIRVWKLRDQAGESPGGTRRLSNLVNQLFESISNPGTGLPYANEDLARWSQEGEERSNVPVLTLERIEAMREGRPIPYSEGDLLRFCDFFNVDFSYFGDTVASLDELDPEVAEARMWRAEQPDYWLQDRFFLEDLRSLLDERGWSVEQAAREIGAIHPQRLRAVLNRKTRAPHEFQRAVGEAMGLPDHVTRERWMGHWVLNDLVP